MRKTLILARPLMVAGVIALLAACASAPEPKAPATAAPTVASPESLLAEGDAALERGDLPQAARAYRMAAEASDDEAVAEQATRMAFDNFQLQEASRSADRWLALNPSSEQAQRYAGVSALALHRIAEADEHFAELLKSAYISPAAGFLSLLPVIMGEGTPPDVTELFRLLAARHPKVAEGQDALGTAALRSDNYSLAMQSAQRAVELAPYWVPAKMLLARTQIAAGQEEQGLATAKELVMAPESDISTHIEYALMLAGTGRDQEARAVLTPYATGQSVVPAALRSLGLMDLQSDDLKAAAARFEALLATGSQSYEALYYLGVIADRRNDPDMAIRFYTRVVSGEYAIAAQQRIARIKASKSGLDAGLAHLEEFGRSQPSLGPQVVMARAGLLSEYKDDRRAIAELDAGLAKYPDVFELRMARVFAFERAGKTDASIKDLRQLLADRPGDPVVQNALGYTLADHDRQLDEAQVLLTAALAQMPDSGAVLDSMGWLLYRQKHYQQAVAYLKRAQELSDEAEIDLHLGDAQWALGDKAAARKTWQEALERYPDNAALKERLARPLP
ncbi:MAG: tetratricopeptide repeat protein [Gammaproteobacteria bacterium]|nr:tetratricopeptide repeat protein [Gammaproteobacteria bacterium]